MGLRTTGRLRAGVATAGGGGGGAYNISNVIAAMRADADYGSLLTSTSNPYSPTGLALPTAPSGTLVNTPVSSLAQLRTEAGLGTSTKRITLAPGTYTETLNIPAVYVQGTDLEIVLTGCTINTLTTDLGIATARTARRINIIGGTINSGFQLNGRDIKVYNSTFVGSGVYNAPFNADANSNTGSVAGHRINMERVTATLAGGAFFIGTSSETLFNATFNGTTVMTVNSVSDGILEVGQKVLGISVGVTAGTQIVNQLTGPAGGAGTYTISNSIGASSGNCYGQVQSTNCFVANCNLNVPSITGTQGTLHENPIRVNGGTFCGSIDSRLWCQDKHTWRSHASYSDVIASGTNFYVRNQSERGGLYGDEPGASGIYPATQNIIIDNRNGRAGDGLYRPSGMGNNLCSIPYLVGASVLNVFVYMKGFKSYSAPHEGTNGTGVTPTGLGSPDTTWTTCSSAATSLSNGNIYLTYVAPPAWSFQ